jgi:uncharacterized membrane protein
MKKSLTIKARTVTIGLAAWLAVTNLLIGMVYATNWWIFGILAFFGMVFLPGIAIIRALDITFKNFPIGVLYSFGLSLLVLMLSGLVANQLFHALGVAHPLQTGWTLGTWDVVAAAIIAIGFKTNPKKLYFRRWSHKNISGTSQILIGLSILLPCFAVAGAFRLNNGGDGLFAMITLGFAATVIAAAFIFRRRLSDGAITWLIFSISLTILLMTSLRGWDIVGHDIEREFRVYSLTHLHGLWDINLYRDPYNACLSITILPEMFATFLHTSGLLVFKVILQIIFAACPAVLYLLLRRYVPKLGALVGCLLFISYPTFINDSAMLTRQGVAYFFFALALFTLSTKNSGIRYKVLFLMCSLGAILSHYSTAYMYVALFAVAVLCKLLITWWHKVQKRPAPDQTHKTILSPFFAATLFAMTFLWYTQITATSSGLITTLQKSLSNIPELFSSDNKSSDTSTALLFASKKTQADLYQSYLASTQPHSRTDISQYIPTLTDDSLPLTPLGERMNAIGLAPSIITTLRQNFAKVLQVLALLGVIYVTYGLLRRKPSGLPLDFTALGIAGIILLALLVVLPVLSINYGILRAFQQALIFLILPMTLLLVAIGGRVNRKVATFVATTSILTLFFLFTGMFAQLLGGTGPSLSMNNSGLYYGLYYGTQSDARSFTWLRTHIPKIEDVRAANFNRALMHDPTYPFTRSGILPSQIGANTYIYLDPSQVTAGKVYAYYDSSPLIMIFPTDYYSGIKNQIYSTATTRIYQ